MHHYYHLVSLSHLLGVLYEETDEVGGELWCNGCESIVTFVCLWV